MVLFGGKKTVSLNKNKQEIDIIKLLDEKILEKEKSDGFNKHKALASGQDILKKAQEYRIKWSDVYKDIMALEENNVIFYNMTSGRHQNFNINALSTSMENISDLLVKLKNNKKFNDPFVSQITEIKKDEQKAYNFTLSFEYKK
jgi:hypothetical protein